jgi:erythritol transport system permease protein
LVDGLVLIGVSVFWQETIKGAVIIVAVAVEEIQRILERRQKLKSAS